jgi:hypothetical protein
MACPIRPAARPWTRWPVNADRPGLLPRSRCAGPRSGRPRHADRRPLT